MPARLSRRDFLKCSVVAGIGVYIAQPGSAALAALFERERLRPVPWDARSGHIRYHTDATAKVSGEKVFSFDMRARDLPGWPDTQSHAMLLRVTRADHAYAGFDLSVLGEGLRPDRIVTAADLQRDGVEEGHYRFLCTGDIESFKLLGTRFLQLPLEKVEHVDLETAVV